jgi:hypothetical protein
MDTIRKLLCSFVASRPTIIVIASFPTISEIFRNTMNATALLEDDFCAFHQPISGRVSPRGLRHPAQSDADRG